MSNPFAVIPAKLRQALYLAYGIAGIAIGVGAIWDMPNIDKWTGSLVVIGTALGFVAGANTDTSSDDIDDE